MATTSWLVTKWLEGYRLAVSGREEFDPIEVVTSIVAAKCWDEWASTKADADRVARRVSLAGGIVVAVVGLGLGALLLPGPWSVAGLFYGPVLGWAASSGSRKVILRARLRRTIPAMRAELDPAEVSGFETDVLVAMLSNPLVPAARHHRMITIARDGDDVVIDVLEYDMSKFAPVFMPNAGGGIG